MIHSEKWSEVKGSIDFFIDELLDSLGTWAFGKTHFTNELTEGSQVIGCICQFVIDCLVWPNAESRGDPSIDELLPLLKQELLEVEEVYAEDIWYYPVEVETTGKEGINH